ncbi:transposable element Tc1 transposase [Trichonephila clavipes]|nr:transposable element Tc1 transposase [Trichonephila clavipes]
MSPIEHEWDIVGRRIARDLRPVASTDELWLRIQTKWNTLPQTDIKNVFNSMARRVAALIAARVGGSNYGATKDTQCEGVETNKLAKAQNHHAGVAWKFDEWGYIQWRNGEYLDPPEKSGLRPQA